MRKDKRWSVSGDGRGVRRFSMARLGGGRGDDARKITSEGEPAWQSEKHVGCGWGGETKQKREVSEWVKEKLVVFWSDEATLKHVKSPTTTVSQT